MHRNTRYKRTRKGLSYVIYSSQKHHSIQRHHELPNYSLEEFRDWLFSQDNFEELYQNWVNSGYDKWNKPSVDRDEDSKPYTFSNIRLTIWKENDQKAKRQKAKGEKINKGNPHKPVIQYDLDGNFIDDHISTRAASRKSGASQGAISNACNKRNNCKIAGGFKWEFKNITIKLC